MRINNRSSFPPKEVCPPPGDIVAYVCDGSFASRRRIAEHLENCSGCRKLAAETKAVRERLSAEDDKAVCRDILTGVIHRIRQEPLRRHRRPRLTPVSPWEMWMRFRLLPVTLAAGILLVLGLGGAVLFRLASGNDRRSPAEEMGSGAPTLKSAVLWLASQQSSDGGWDAGALGGRREFAPALNGLSLLALSRQFDASGEPWSSLLQGARALLRFQTPGTGRFGDDGYGTMYNHGIATLAVLSAFGQTGEESLYEPARRAVAFILETQSANGGWGYGTARQRVRSDASITAWQLQSLLLARHLGMEEGTQAIRRGLAWMAGHMRGADVFRYGNKRGEISSEDIPRRTIMSAYCILVSREKSSSGPNRMVEEAIGRLRAVKGYVPRDYYEAFFYASALRQVDPEFLAGNIRTPAASLSLAAAGKQEGAWPAEDRWSEVGGRLYSTAMAVLALDGADGSFGW